MFLQLFWHFCSHSKILEIGFSSRSLYFTIPPALSHHRSTKINKQQEFVLTSQLNTQNFRFVVIYRAGSYDEKAGLRRGGEDQEKKCLNSSRLAEREESVYISTSHAHTMHHTTQMHIKRHRPRIYPRLYVHLASVVVAEVTRCSLRSGWGFQAPPLPPSPYYTHSAEEDHINS